MRKFAPSPQRQMQPPYRFQTLGERLHSPQPVFEPEQAEPQVSHDEIAQRAYAIYRERGMQAGSDLDDWLKAEQELRTWGRTDEYD